MAEHAQHISCREVVELVTDYFEGALSPEQTALFEQHLNFCEGCVRYLDQMKATLDALGRLREEDVPEEVKAPLLAAFRGWRRD